MNSLSRQRRGSGNHLLPVPCCPDSGIGAMRRYQNIIGICALRRIHKPKGGTLCKNDPILLFLIRIRCVLTRCPIWGIRQRKRRSWIPLPEQRQYPFATHSVKTRYASPADAALQPAYIPIPQAIEPWRICCGSRKPACLKN